MSGKRTKNAKQVQQTPDAVETAVRSFAEQEIPQYLGSLRAALDLEKRVNRGLVLEDEVRSYRADHSASLSEEKDDSRTKSEHA